MFEVEPFTRAGKLALDIYAEVLAQVRADNLVGQAVKRAGDLLFIQDAALNLSDYARIFMCGAGKASIEMAEPVIELLGERLSGGLIVTKEARSLPGVPVMQGSHPVPDERSIAAGEAMLSFAEATTSDDLVIFCLSGGASALMEAPIPGISLTDLRTTTELLLAGGADISTLNSVRIRLSQIKGGGLANAFKAKVVVLVLSDVIGHDLSVVGSGPFLALRQSHLGHAAALGLEDKLPVRVREALTSQVNVAEPPRIEHFVVGSAALLWPLAAEAATNHGLTPVGYSNPLKGEARTMAGKIMRLANAKQTRGEREFCMFLVGEPTVTVRGQGLGGRCQEMATRASTVLRADSGLAFLAAGTDGADGPTDAAGGLVEPGSANLGKLSGLSAAKALASSDSYHFLEGCGGLLRTGPTGSNVNDIVLVVQA